VSGLHSCVCESVCVCVSVCVFVCVSVCELLSVDYTFFSPVNALALLYTLDCRARARREKGRRTWCDVIQHEAPRFVLFLLNVLLC